MNKYDPTQNGEQVSIRNPFRDPWATEFIEEPGLYRRVFSERILVGSTLDVYQPLNVVVIGPQGSGKSMILNLVRYGILSEWLSSGGKPPEPLRHMNPFFGISINLVRACFPAFGRRSVSRVTKGGEWDEALDAAAASDFLNHYLFREFLKGFNFLLSRRGSRLRSWLGMERDCLTDESVIENMSNWEAWMGYYSDSRTLDDLMTKCDRRLSVWRSFLNANINEIPKNIWKTKSSPGDPLHAAGNLLTRIRGKSTRLPLFVVIDQYEELPELNPKYGSTLQRVINTLIKARDPVVFYKVGARTHDWGTELRTWGSESRIEVQRDYVTVDLTRILTRHEDPKGWLFPRVCVDVAHRRIREQGKFDVPERGIQGILGEWKAEGESRFYFKDSEHSLRLLNELPVSVRKRIVEECGSNPSPLELRLAAAWAQEKLRVPREKLPLSDILRMIKEEPWNHIWWRKERIGVALLQLASEANQKKLYYGWDTVMYLSGGNISIFLLLCREIWNVAARHGYHPLKTFPLPPRVQTDGIHSASERWRIRDSNERLGGAKRYEVLSRLGPAIKEHLIGDSAISNPGHSGFSLPEWELWRQDGKEEKSRKVRRFLQTAVNWAILEERSHTSKMRDGATRQKWYLHPVLSPFFAIPYVRVKEPLYVRVDDVYDWIYGSGRIKFVGRVKQGKKEPTLLPGQTKLLVGE